MPLIGRADEISRLNDLVDRLPEQGGAAAVVGAAGIGKSTLLAAAERRGRARGVRVLRTAGVLSEVRLPFAGLHHLLRPVLDTVPALPSVQRNALLSAFGALEGPAPDPFMIALATLNLLSEVAARQPLLVVVDDAQWLDQSTHDALAFVARRVGSDPLVMVTAVRQGYDGAFLTAGLPVRELGGLDTESARELLAVTAADLYVADRERILRAARGNPLALVELPIAFRARGAGARAADLPALPLTKRLEDTFVGRAFELPPAARDFLLVAAVDSTDDAAEILAAASALGGHHPAGPLPGEGFRGPEPFASAVTAGLLRVDLGQVEFRHPLVRSGVLQSESAARIRAAHAALASVLEDEPYRSLWHRAQSITGPDDEVAAELHAGHEQALRRGSVAAAIQALERAAQLTSDPELRSTRLLLAAEHAFGLGRAAMVDRLVNEACRDDLSELNRARSTWLREIFSDGVPGDAERVFEMCRMARRAAGARDPDLALNLLLGAALRCWWADAGAAARAEVVRVAEELDGVRDDPRYVAVLGVAEPVARGRAVIESLSRMDSRRVTEADALRLLGMAAHAVGDQPRALDLLERSEARLREQARLGLLPHVLGMLAPVRLDLGYWERAAAGAEEGRLIAEETGQPVWGTGQLVNEARGLALRGETARALALAAEAESAPELHTLDDFRACAQLARGYALTAAGRYAEAFQALLRVFDPDEPSYHQRERFAGLSFLAEAAVPADRIADARRVLAEMERVGEVTPSPLLHVHLRYARAVLADDADAEPLYRAAMAVDLTAAWPWHRARIEFAYGSWLRRRRRLGEAREMLRSARISFALVGAAPWAEQVRTELRAAGEHTLGDGDAGHNTLSAQELQIARLAAAGLSNRQIAERLFLSDRTVGSHLYRIFPKLGITSRSQLAARLDPQVLSHPARSYPRVLRRMTEAAV
ncbi:AAA family ATPase [Streptomyces sp. NBC_01136]|uniref:helix-turn-helix transcriptional regulator n=1 Tax=unclassified Streptomyces TaxID=2593676 RepID=UPI0032533889|nr:AAA family ATPase [Streptomyces sp. NBC_01136]